MTDNNSDTFARRSGSVLDRRGSLKTLGAALVAAVQPLTSDANKRDKQIRRKCRKQGDACREFAIVNCAGFSDPAACEVAFAACCPLLEKCQAVAYFACLEQAGST